MIYTALYSSPIGPLTLRAEQGKIIEILFGIPQKRDIMNTNEWSASCKPTCDTINEAKRQLSEYFFGSRTHFTLPLNLHGTDFQKKVWTALLQIPYGKTASYSDMAFSIGSPNASRAVGMANHNNPIVIVVPCHRVIGKSGKLVGYGGGIHRKEWLLHHEQLL